jgi:hypothetical protein
MFAPADNAYRVSKSPHSIGLQNNLTVPSAWGDSNPLIKMEKAALTAGLQGKGFSGLGDFDPTEITTALNSEVFQGTGVTLWMVGAGMVALWWLATPHGSEYRAEKARLRQKHMGISKLSRALSSGESRDDYGPRSKRR